MLNIVFRDSTGKQVVTKQFQPGTMWKDIVEDSKYFVCVPCGTLQPVDNNLVVQNHMEIFVQGEKCKVDIQVFARREKLHVVASMDDTVAELVAKNKHLVQSGETFANMWDPVQNQYASPEDIHTPLRDMLKPIDIRVEPDAFAVHNVMDVVTKWPYRLKNVSEFTEGIYEVESHDAVPFIVFRGDNCKPLLDRRRKNKG